MDFQNYWYFFLLLALAGLTAFLLLKKTIVFIMEFKYMLPAILFSGAIFILFNNRLLETGILDFNQKYLVGKTLYHLPIEEWFYLLIISLLSFAVYLLVSVKFEKTGNQYILLALSVVLLAGIAYVAWSTRDKLIPFFISFLLAIYFAYTLFRKRFQEHLAKFYISFLITAVPFFISKAILNSLPVIIYSNEHIFGIRLINMPVEEFGYLFLLMLINITIFEYLRNNHLY
jgi:lycopene cyclase domain-containing protein